MTRRARLALLLFVPILAVVFVAVHALWYAYTRTLNETELHGIADHIRGVLAALWGTVAVVGGILAWAIAGRLARRGQPDRDRQGMMP